MEEVMDVRSDKRLPVTYSIKNISACILADNQRARRHSAVKKKTLYAACQALLDQHPALKALLTRSHIRSYPVPGSENFVRIGVLPPALVVVDRRFQEMCTLPYWTVYNDSKGAVYKRFGKCPGYGWLPCCPPRSIKVEKTQAVLDRADFFVVIQTKQLQERWHTSWKFTVLHNLARDIRKAVGCRANVAVFGSGPCESCQQQLCRHNQPCESPRLQTTALESAGICVDRLCSDLSAMTGNAAWNLTWVKHFGLPQQTPKSWKYVMGLAITV